MALSPFVKRRREPRIAVGSAAAACAAFVLLLVLAPVSGAPGASAPPTNWSNGLVTCQFAPGEPTAAVSAAGDLSSGIAAGLEFVKEVGPDNVTVATAQAPSNGWTAWNASGAGAYTMEYGAAVPIVAGNGTTEPRDVDITVAYTLPVWSGAPAANEVVAEVSITNWTWSARSDHLVLGLALSSIDPDTDRFGETASDATTAGLYSTGANRLVGSFAPGPNASILRANGTTVPVRVVPTFGIGPTGGATSLAVGNASTGAYSGLRYSVVVEIAVPPPLAALPSVDYAAVAVLGAAVAAAAAVGLYRRRQGPSRLEFAEDP